MKPQGDAGASEPSDFSLRRLQPLLREYVPPPIGKFDPGGSWRQGYAMYVLMPRGGGDRVGEVALTRTPKRSAEFTLGIQTRRLSVSGFSQFQRAEMVCKADALASPSSWIFDTKLARDANDPPYLQSGRRRNGSVRNGVLSVGGKIRTRNTAVNGRYSNEWSLLEAIQRLPGQETPAMQYTLIDEYDALQPGHTLSFRNHVTLPCTTGNLDLTGYCDLGSGVIPTTYWVDAHHRLIFVCSGLQIYALETANGQSGQCPPRFVLSEPVPARRQPRSGSDVEN